MRMPGVICVTKSLSRVALPTKTLSVYVSRSVMSGVTVQRAVAAGVANIRIGSAARATLRRPLRSIGVIAVKAGGPRRRRLVEKRMDDGARVDGRQRRLEHRVRGALGLDYDPH